MSNKTYTTFSVQDQNGNYHDIEQSTLVKAAQECIRSNFVQGEALTSPKASATHLQVLLGSYPHEVFTALWLNSQHQVISHMEIFRGTIDGASVYPREVVKEGLAVNAAAVILAHNHPSGSSEPSQADIQITKRLKDALALVDIRVLDHLIVGERVTSLAERGLI